MPLAAVCNRLGQATVSRQRMKSIGDAETGEPLNGDCPWWSSYEAVRTWAELLELARDDAARTHCIAQLILMSPASKIM
ncbi:hypothetical protein MASR2M78_03670 [Treponema sp.]